MNSFWNHQPSSLLTQNDLTWSHATQSDFDRFSLSNRWDWFTVSFIWPQNDHHLTFQAANWITKFNSSCSLDHIFPPVILGYFKVISISLRGRRRSWDESKLGNNLCENIKPFIFIEFRMIHSYLEYWTSPY